MSGRVGVILLNLGGPEKLDDVYLFLYNLFADPEIIRLPFPFLQKPIASLIAASRALDWRRFAIAPDYQRARREY
jgi:ferrochelatase